MKKVAIFGDSVSKGVILDKQSRRYKFADGIDWANLENRLNINIDNHSKMGATITYGFKKLKQYLNTKPDVDTIVLLYGGNDCDYDWVKVAAQKSHDYLAKTPIDVFRKTLIDTVLYIKSHGIKPILLTLPSIHAHKYYQWISRLDINMENVMYFLGDIQHIYRHHELYNMTILEVAHKLQVQTIDLRKVFLNHRDPDKMICDDGIHPSIYAEKLAVEHIIDQVLHTYNKKEISQPMIRPLSISYFQKESL